MNPTRLGNHSTSSGSNHRKNPGHITSSNQKNMGRSENGHTTVSDLTRLPTRNLINTSTTPVISMSLTIGDRRHTDETNAEKIYRDIIIFCQQSQSHFVDDQFPPIPRSIGQINSLNNHSLQWLRISDITSSSQTRRHVPWSVYSSPKPSDIQQGALGDCWLMAALALITERPQMLEHILLTKSINAEGVYLVRICHNGVWKTVIVDDCFPCTEYKQLAFTQANGHQLYVPLIEKACAKLFGSYADLISGQTEEGLQLLTGAPCDHIELNPLRNTVDSDIIWAKLLSACESHLLIGASTGRSDISEQEYANNHIHGNHAFSVLAAHSLSHISMQFVLVRDPHARSNYNDELLTRSLINQLSSIYPNSISPGAFWISWPKFLRFFNSITISSYASDYYDVREVARFTRSSTQSISTFHFHISKTSLVNVSLLYHRQNRRTRNFHTQSFVLCNVEQGSSKEVGTFQAILHTSRGAFTHWIGSLRPGFYVLIPFSTSFWAEENISVQDYTLVIHSKVQINVQVIKEPASLLADCLIATVLRSNIPAQKGKDYNYYVTTEEHSLTIFIAENLSPTDYLNLDIDLNDSIRIRNSRQALITHNCIPPRHRQIIFLVEWSNETGETAKMDYVYKSQHVKQSNNSIPEVYIAQNDFHSFRPF